MIVMWEIGRYLIPVLRIVLILLHCICHESCHEFSPLMRCFILQGTQTGAICENNTDVTTGKYMYSMRVRELETASLRWRCCNVDHTYSVWEWGIWNLTMHSAYKNKTNWTTPLIKFPVIPDNKLYPHLVKLLKFRPCSFVLIDL